MKPVVFVMPGQEALGESLLALGNFEKGVLELRHFPDGESYVRVHGNVADAQILILCQLHKPDEKILPLFVAGRDPTRPRCA